MASEPLSVREDLPRSVASIAPEMIAPECIASAAGTLRIEWHPAQPGQMAALSFCDGAADPLSSLSPSALVLQQWLDAGLPQPCPLPLYLPPHSSEFRRCVWQAIMSIPPGKTLTYTELAVLMGQPKAVRAVASACAANQLALVIPCHRIVPAAGGVGQYRWGAERKQRLLLLEQGG